jgi:hypothetical protein
MNEICMNNEDEVLREKLKEGINDCDLERLQLMYDIYTKKYLDNSYPALWKRSSGNIKHIKQCAYDAAGLTNVAFFTSIIISTLIILLLIIYNPVCDWVPNRIWRFFVLWIIFIALIFIVEMCVAQYYTK